MSNLLQDSCGCAVHQTHPLCKTSVISRLSHKFQIVLQKQKPHQHQHRDIRLLLGPPLMCLYFVHHIGSYLLSAHTALQEERLIRSKACLTVGGWWRSSVKKTLYNIWSMQRMETRRYLWICSPVTMIPYIWCWLCRRSWFVLLCWYSEMFTADLLSAVLCQLDPKQRHHVDPTATVGSHTHLNI